MEAVCRNRNAESMAPLAQRTVLWRYFVKEETLYVVAAIIFIHMVDLGLSALMQVVASCLLLGALGGFELVFIFLTSKKLPTASIAKKGKASITPRDELAQRRHERRTISCIGMAARVARVRVVSEFDDSTDFTGYPPAPEPHRIGSKLVFCTELNQGHYRYVFLYITITPTDDC